METTSQAPKQSVIIAGILSILLLLFIVSLTGSNPVLQLFGTTTINATVLFISRIGYWVCLLFIWFYAIKIEKQNLLLWDEKHYKWTMHLLSFLAIFGAIILGSGLINGILYLAHIKEHSDKMDMIMAIFRTNKLLMVLTAFTAGVTEELIFRGYMQPRLELLFKNSWVAIFISSFLFGLMHYRYGTLVNMLVPFFMGLVFAFYYSRYRNIKLLILFHFVWDMLVVIAHLLPHHLK